jgi:uncharacterized Zn finger protein
MAIFAGASAGAVVKLECPACGEVQARARAPKGTVYECRACGRPIPTEKPRAPKRKSRRR